MPSAYRVLLNIALRAQSAIGNRLREQMQNSELSNENFELYKKWETKAINYGIANVTGLGKQYWECSINDLNSYSGANCPGYFEPPFDYPQWNFEYGRDVVHWRLLNHDGFRTFLNDTLRLDLDDLEPGTILVNRAINECVAVGGARKRELSNATNWADPADSDAVDDGTGRVRWPKDVPPRKTRLNKRHNGPSPYDPDPDCFTTWVGIPLVNATKFFVDMPEAITNLIDQHDYQLDMGYEIADAYFVEPRELAAALESSLTTISMANTTLGSVAVYIEAVKRDQDLQEEFDRFNARNQALEIFLEIGLTLIGLIPIPGLQVPAFVQRAWLTVKNLSPLVKLGRSTGALRGETAFTRALGLGIRDADDVARLKPGFETSLTKEVRDTRGACGSKMVKNNDKIKKCNRDKSEFLMEAADLAIQYIPPPELGAVARRLASERRRLSSHATNSSASPPSNNLDLGLSFESSDNATSRSTSLQPRAPAKSKQNCIFRLFSASAFKGTTSSEPNKGYREKCYEKDTIISWIDEDQNSWVSGTMTDCPATICQCDHVFEAFQIMQTLRIGKEGTGKKARSFWNPGDIKTLCDGFPSTFKQGILDIMNRPDNLVGIDGYSNTIKSNLLDPTRLKNDLLNSAPARAGNSDVIDDLEGRHMDFEDERIETARLLDEHFQTTLNNMQTAKPDAYNLFKAKLPEFFNPATGGITAFRDVDTRNALLLEDRIKQIRANYPVKQGSTDPPSRPKTPDTDVDMNDGNGSGGSEMDCS